MGWWIIFFLFLAVIFFWPQISAWLQRAAIRKAEKMFREAAGMPPRSKEKSSNRQHAQKQGFRTSHQRYRSDYSPHIIPPEYAEDVEFTEIRTYSEDVFRKKGEEIRVKQENQVSDAEWEEVK